MKLTSLFSMSFLLFSVSIQAQDCVELPTGTEGGGLKTIMDTWAAAQEKDAGAEKLKTYAANDKDYKIVKLEFNPSQVSSTGLEYRFPYTKLKPQECIYLKVPTSLENKPILFVTLGHTQSPEDNTGWDAKKKWDANPALTSIQVNETNDKGESKWRYWDGMSSGEFGAKFAEPDHMELEGLYEWYKNGHGDIKTKQISHELLSTDAIRLCSLGKDTVTLGSLGVKFSPGVAKEYKEFNFSKSNNMGDSITAKGRSYGDRDDALMFTPYGGGAKPSAKLPAGWKKEGGTLSIPAEVGKKLKSYEAAIGDIHTDGKSGYARLGVYIQKKNGQTISIINHENIPPEGVLLGSPEEDYVLQEGDKIVTNISYDEAFLMGLKLGYD